MKEVNYSFFCNRSCEFYPCHEVKDEEGLNCIFCFCPLYHLGEACGGDFTYTDAGIKDCSKCTLPHSPQSGYKFVINKLKQKKNGIN